MYNLYFIAPDLGQIILEVHLYDLNSWQTILEVHLSAPDLGEIIPKSEKRASDSGEDSTCSVLILVDSFVCYS